MEIYQLREATPQRIQMMSYIFRGENGELAVMDGGNWGDGEHLLEALRAVSGCRSPHIAAWLMTHAHSDHVDAFQYLMDRHPGDFSVEKLYYCFPSQPYLDAYEPEEAHTLREMTERMGKMAPDMLHQVCVGEEIAVGELHFTVLLTPDEVPLANVVNNASVVYRLEGGGLQALFLGDLGVEGGERLLSLYGDTLASDMVQMAHHGQNGVDRPVYEAIRPDICLWPTPSWLWDNDPGSGYNTGIWKTLCVRAWMREIGAKRHVVSKDGDFQLTCQNGNVQIEKISFTES